MQLSELLVITRGHLNSWNRYHCVCMMAAPQQAGRVSRGSRVFRLASAVALQ